LLCKFIFQVVIPNFKAEKASKQNMYFHLNSWETSKVATLKTEEVKE